jgi:hypothetical protein
MTESINSLLLEILTTIGEVKGDLRTIEGRLAVGSERHRDFAKSLDAIDLRVEAIKIEMQKIPPLVVAVEDMAPKVKNLMEFRGRMAAIMLVASTVIGGAFMFIWEGLKYFWPDIQSLYSRFH